MSDGKSYLLTVRKDCESNVVSTIKKYYDELLDSVVVRPADIDGVVRIEAAYELPQEALERIAEIEDVRQLERQTDATDPESLAKLCADIRTELTSDANIEVQVTTRGDSGPATEVIEQTCTDVISETFRSGTPTDWTYIIRIDVIDDWAGISIDTHSGNDISL